MTWAELIAAAEGIREAAPAPAAPPLVGIGWVSVDEERARAELDGLLAGDPGAPPLRPWAPMDRDAGLGARGWLRAPVQTGGAPALVVLEPDTEGRVAACLARFGEGVGVIYVGEGIPRPSRLLASGAPAWGPHVVVMAGPVRARP